MEQLGTGDWGGGAGRGAKSSLEHEVAEENRSGSERGGKTRQHGHLSWGIWDNWGEVASYDLSEGEFLSWVKRK